MTILEVWTSVDCVLRVVRAKDRRGRRTGAPAQPAATVSASARRRAHQAHDRRLLPAEDRVHFLPRLERSSGLSRVPNSTCRVPDIRDFEAGNSVTHARHLSRPGHGVPMRSQTNRRHGLGERPAGVRGHINLSAPPPPREATALGQLCWLAEHLFKRPSAAIRSRIGTQLRRRVAEYAGGAAPPVTAQAWVTSPRHPPRFGL
jgi:hypothetical protein